MTPDRWQQVSQIYHAALAQDVRERGRFLAQACGDEALRRDVETLLAHEGTAEGFLWSRDGRELFFGTLDGRQIFAVAIQPETTLVPGRPQLLFEFAMFTDQGGRPYDIAPDGRFLIIRRSQAEAGGTPSNLILVQNWTEELKRLVRVN